ncbi:MAG: hypothetical protein J6X81_00955 [Muribaculaceae bacterium]|nr:hypothetical protein [Muribaculaceae bacterium]
MKITAHRIIPRLTAVLVLALSLTGVQARENASVSQEDSTAYTSVHSTKSLHRDRRTVNVPQKELRDKESGVRIVNIEGDTVMLSGMDSIADLQGVEIINPADSAMAPNLGKIRIFNPDPMRAMWLSALFPGAGQIYNRRYWKLPIIVGAFVGLSYGMSWNNRMLSDYTKAYRDAMDDDPNTRSYMDLFAPTVKEETLDKSWLQNVLRSKRNYYRRYRDICIFCMVGVYLLNVLDAYVDASLAHFDISPDLSMKVRPAVMQPDMTRLPAVGLQCAVNF